MALCRRDSGDVYRGADSEAVGCFFFGILKEDAILRRNQDTSLLSENTPNYVIVPTRLLVECEEIPMPD